MAGKKMAEYARLENERKYEAAVTWSLDATHKDGGNDQATHPQKGERMARTKSEAVSGVVGPAPAELFIRLKDENWPHFRY